MHLIHWIIGSVVQCEPHGLLVNDSVTQQQGSDTFVDIRITECCFMHLYHLPMKLLYLVKTFHLSCGVTLRHVCVMVGEC